MTFYSFNFNRTSQEDPYNKRADLKRVAKKLAQKNGINAPEFSIMDKGAIRDWINKNQNNRGGSSGSGGGSSNSADSSLYQNAKDLAQQQLDADLRKMGAAHGYRTSEANQQQGFRTANAWQDSDIRMKEANQQHGFNLASKHKDYEYTSALNREQHRYGLENKAADYRYADALGKSQYGYQLGLQRDNNAARLKIQNDAQEHDTGMFNLRDQADKARTTAAYDRARSAFRGRY